MKKFLVVMAAMLLMMSTAAFADTITAQMTGVNTVTFTVVNEGPANNAADLISGFYFTCSTCTGAGSLTNSGTGNLVDVSDTGVITSAGSTTSAGWTLQSSGSTGFVSIFGTGGITPQHTIFGATIGNNCGGSLCKTGGPHNPFLYTPVGGSVTFTLVIPGLTSTTQLSNLSLFYGTAPPEPGGQTPEPASMFLLGTGLVGIGGAIRRKIRL